jgi:hypothetical protein
MALLLAPYNEAMRLGMGYVLKRSRVDSDLHAHNFLASIVTLNSSVLMMLSANPVALGLLKAI